MKEAYTFMETGRPMQASVQSSKRVYALKQDKDIFKSSADNSLKVTDAQAELLHKKSMRVSKLTDFGMKAMTSAIYLDAFASACIGGDDIRTLSEFRQLTTDDITQREEEER